MALSTRAAISIVVLSLTAAPHALEAQELSGGKPFLVSVSSWAKWGFLAGAIGLTAVAAMQRADGDDLFSDLHSICRQQSAACVLAPDGSAYLDSNTEDLYRSVLAADHSAQRYLFFGQLALVTSGGMFLLDLIWDDGGGPENIPYTPLEVFSNRDQVGLRIRF